MQSYDVDDYTGMLAGLLPRGAAWPTGEGSVWRRFLAALARECARVDQSGHLLMREANPQTTALLLPEWETEVGLPDQCSQDDETVAERRAAVVHKLARRGGATPEYFEELALVYGADLGQSVSVEEFTPFRAGASAAGDGVTNGDWTHAFLVHGPSVYFRVFRADSGAAGEPLRSWGNERLECVVNKYKPAHTVALFSYDTQEE